MKAIREIAKDFLNFLGHGYPLVYSRKNAVFITGCDSGLGFNLALLCHSMNMSVIAGCRNTYSEGAKMLRNICCDDANRMTIIGIDLNLQDSIIEAQKFVCNFIETNENYKFTALINNAGVMCMGEFEWQTDELITNQINVNVLGTMRVTKGLLPLIRQHQARIINVTSHCGFSALPGAGPYSASKGALRLWNDSLRIEMKQYGVKVVNVIPGSLVAVTNIAARLQIYSNEMWEAFTDEQRQFYGEYFKEYYKYLSVISGFKPPMPLNEQYLLNKFHDALANTKPKPLYIHEPLRYRIYHFLFKICPTSIADWLTWKFCLVPSYNSITKGEQKFL